MDSAATGATATIRDINFSLLPFFVLDVRRSAIRPNLACLVSFGCFFIKSSWLQTCKCVYARTIVGMDDYFFSLAVYILPRLRHLHSSSAIATLWVRRQTII
jgi:hypothetical protein